MLVTIIGQVKRAPHWAVQSRFLMIGERYVVWRRQLFSFLYLWAARGRKEKEGKGSATPD